MRKFLTAIAFFLLATGCGEQPPGAADTDGLKRVSFRLGGNFYAILLPQEARLSFAAADMVRIRDRSKSTRLERAIELTSESKPGAGYDRTIKLFGGGQLSYRIKDDVGGGSGGPTAELSGQIRINGQTVSANCTDQNELSRHADWCIPYLHHLTIERR